MIETSPGLPALLSLVRSWGGDIIYVADIGDRFSPAPFNFCLGLDWHARLVACRVSSPGPIEDPVMLGSVIHEVAHLFATLKEPWYAEEYDFLGWEWAVARDCGLVDEWLDSMGSYSVGDGDDFGALDVDQQTDLLEERFDFAVSIGLIVNDRPVSLRKGSEFP